MKKKIPLLFMGIGLIIQSCGLDAQPSMISHTDFPDGGTLTGSRVFENEIGVANVQQAGAHHVLSVMGGEPIFKVYDQHQQYVGRFGKRGRGPGEFADSGFELGIQIYPSSDGYSALYIDNRLLLTSVIDITASIESGETVISKYYELPNNMMSVFRSDQVFQRDSLLFGFYYDQTIQLLDGKSGMFRYDVASRKLDIFPTHYLNITPYNAQAEGNLNAREAAYSRSQNRVAHAMMYVPRLDVLDVESNTTKTRLFDFGEHKTEFALEDYQNFDLVMYFHSLRATEAYLYLLHAGTPMKDFGSGNQSKRLLVLDWEGNPICKYTIPDVYDVQTFSVDVDDRALFGVSVTNDFVHRFDLNPASCGN